MVAMPFPMRPYRAMLRCFRLASLCLISALACSAPATAPPAYAEQSYAEVGDAVRGKELAQKHCARCHVISDENRFSGIGSTPSFPLLVNALDDWTERFETFYARRPHPAVIRMEGFEPLVDQPTNAAPINLNLTDASDLLAFVRTLKQGAK